ncbi:uncharacterized protein [Halyomorpha halys]|uniref:uncharacterized protein n=1 Tax=Halyomorpha halys TaxID=286706 RepID=UPI0006D4E22F|nr:uncharacterized protein LOC106683320 [Halyomorpha halys]
MPAALLYFFIIAKVSALESNFLRETLNKIQQERLDNNEEINESDLGSEFNGEIILGTVEEPMDNNLKDQSFTNQVSVHQDGAATYVPNMHHMETQNTDEMTNNEIKGYYYYYYPLNHYLDQNKDTEPTKDSDEMHVMMDTMMKNTMMQTTENKVTPLFKAMTWFIGTAMVFILSILLMPKFKVKKSKVIFRKWENNEFMDTIHRYIPDNSKVSWKIH